MRTGFLAHGFGFACTVAANRPLVKRAVALLALALRLISRFAGLHGGRVRSNGVNFGWFVDIPGR